MVKQHVNHAVLVYVHELDQRDVRRWRGVVRELVDESGISLDQLVNRGGYPQVGYMAGLVEAQPLTVREL